MSATEKLPAKIHGANGVADMLDKLKPQITTALARHVDPDRFVRVALTTLQRTPALGRCTKESFFGSLMECAQLGLEPDGVFGLAYLIPFGDQCQLVPGYKGILELMRRSGDVLDCYSEVVREGDRFRVLKGLHRDLIHEPASGNEAAPVTHVYNVAVLKNGVSRFEVMTCDEVEAIRKRSKAGKSGPWVTDWSEMAKKSVLKRHSKWLPASAELRQALTVDDREYEREREPRTLDITSMEIAPPSSVAVESRAEQKERDVLRLQLDERKIKWLDDDAVEDLRERLTEADAIASGA